MALFILVLAFAAARYKVILGLDLAAYSVASGCKSFFTDNRDIGLVALHLFEIAIGAQPDEDFNCMECAACRRARRPSTSPSVAAHAPCSI